MTFKDDLAELLIYLEGQMAGFADLLTPAERDRAGKEDDWSGKDNLAHSVVWADRRLAVLEKARKGEKTHHIDYGDFDQANLEIFQEHKDKSWAEVLNMIRDSFGGITAYLEAVSEDYLHSTLEGEEQTIWQSIANNYLMHPLIHLWDFLRNHSLQEKIQDIFGEDFFQKLRGLDTSNHWQGLVEYNLACLLALSGETERSLQGLKKALEINPGVKDWSRQDPDLESLRGRPEYQALYREE
jgi:hypothetical protein